MSLPTIFFDFGMLLLLITFSTELLYLLLCRIWKIKVEEISIFFKMGKPIFQREINGVNYLLGWIPFGSYIKPVGMLPEDIEKIHAGDLPFTFLGASRWKRTVFYAVPYIFWVSVLLLCCSFISPEGGLEAGIRRLQFFLATVYDSCTGKITDPQLRELLLSMRTDNVLFLLLSFMLIIYILLTPPSKAMSWLVEPSRHWSLKTIGYLIFVAVLYIYIFKLGALFFRIAGFGNGILYIISFSLGAYLIGTLAFCVLLFAGWLRRK